MPYGNIVAGLDPGFRRGDGMANGILLKLMTLTCNPA